MRFSKVRQLLVDFQLIPSPSLDFQVGLILDETAPLSKAGVNLEFNQLYANLTFFKADLYASFTLKYKGI